MLDRDKVADWLHYLEYELRNFFICKKELVNFIFENKHKGCIDDLIEIEQCQINRFPDEGVLSNEVTTHDTFITMKHIYLSLQTHFGDAATLLKPSFFSYLDTLPIDVR